MTAPATPPSSGKPPSGLPRLWWLLALKLVLMILAVIIALRVYNLI